MKLFEAYEYSLAVTSQFPFCGLPLRLDTYSRCQFACRYCFASARGGNLPSTKIQIGSSESFARRLERVHQGHIQSAIDEMLAQRIPIHLGGMSDPFPPLEKELGVTMHHLNAARVHDYPVIASTKSALVGTDEYLRILTNGNFAIQISIPTIDDALGSVVDAGAPTPSERLKVIAILSACGIPVSCRIQPVLPGRESEVLELIDAAASAGAKQVAVEHLKLPVEDSWPHREALDRALGLNLKTHFAQLGATRTGREWILPIATRLDRVLEYRAFARSKGLYFGAADNDLLHFSDGNVCCSGSDLLGLGDGFRFNFLSAVRGRSNAGEIRADSLQREWRPTRSIARYLNSHSRSLGGTMEEYIMANWNGRSNGTSPETFFGVSRTGRVDLEGMIIYEFAPAVAELVMNDAKSV